MLEVGYEHMEGRRFRHTAQFKRWRPDRDPESCGYEQLEEPVSYDLTRVLGVTDFAEDAVMSDYDVVLLVEQPFTAQDATNLAQLHEDIEDPVRYHVLLPVEDASARVESAMGTLGTGEVLDHSARGRGRVRDLEELQKELLDTCRAGVDATIAVIEQAGGKAVGDPVTSDPIEALVAKVAEVDAAEVIILTRPHVVAEFFHLDWTSRARRKLGVPVLHLLEHENFDEQAGEGEGISGF